MDQKYESDFDAALASLVTAAEKRAVSRVRNQLLQAIDFATLRGERGGEPVQQQSPLELEIRAALDRIAPASEGKEG